MPTRNAFVRSLLLAAACAPALARAQCVASSTGWKNTSIAARTAPFSAGYTAIPGSANMDGVTGLSNGSASGFSSLAVIVRFNNAGYIDARNGSAYAAAAQIPYVAGAAYWVRLAVDPVMKRYSAWITPPGAAERALAVNYAFRAEQAAAASLNNWALNATIGAHQVCGFITAAGADSSAPSVAMTAPAAGAAVSGTVTLAASASNDVGVAGVQFLADGANAGAEDAAAPYSAAWNSASVPDGPHALAAVARDAAGNRTTSAPVSVITGNVAPPPPSGCVTGAAAWKGNALAPQTSAFAATFDATPSAAKIDALVGLSKGAPTAFTSLAVAVRFNNAGFLDARNGGAYAAAAQVPYSAGVKYHFRLAVDPAAKRWSVYVTPPGTGEIALGTSYAFRAEQASTASLDDWSAYATMGTVQACGMAVSGAPPDTTPPAVSFTSPSPGASVSGTVALAATASDNVGVAGVQFQADGAPLGAEAAQTPYAASWNAAGAAAGPHTLAAVARDAAGNRTTASLPVTVTASSSGGTDRFGVKNLYPSLAGGKSWVSSWDNGQARSFSGVDPQDPWFDANHGNASYAVDGKGLFTISGSVPRMYIHDPALQQSWRNIELTVYVYRVADSNTSWGGIVCHARGNHGTTGSETANLCDTRGVGARFRYDGHLDFEKETSHPASTAVANKPMWSTLPFKTWIGYKLVVYDLPNGDVKLESWLDLTDGANGGSWTKVNEFEDTGSNFAVGGAACKSGINPALRLTNSDARPGSESGKPNITVYCRTDNVAANGMITRR